jgi:predicted nucleic acid-binding protein
MNMMKIYAESNFILELAFQQEQYLSCQNILLLCETKKADLVIPAFCIAEPYEAFVRKSKARDTLRRKLREELQQLSRNTSRQTQLDTLENVRDLLLTTTKEEKQRLQHTLKRILNMCELIQMGPEVLTLAAQVEEQLEMSLQDSIVYASVVHHLSTNNGSPKCFLNRNSKDFNKPDIQVTLENHHCKLLFNFKSGYNYIRSQVEPP